MDWGNVFSQALTQGIGIQAVIFALAAIGLNVQFGYTGLLNFGQSGFLAVAAYGLGVSIAYAGWSLWVGLLVGILAAALLALLLGVPTLRLRADYLAIVTIAAAEILRLTFRPVSLDPIFGGSDGINRFADDFYTFNPYPRPLRVGPVQFSQNDMWIITIGWILVVVLSLPGVHA